MPSMHEGSYFTYIMASRSHTLYIGVTEDLLKRVFQHKWKEHEGFTAKYNRDGLVWLEAHQDIAKAISREKPLKSWRRAKKISLIESTNPAWTDFESRMARLRAGLLSTCHGPNESIRSNRRRKQPQILRCASGWQLGGEGRVSSGR